MSQDFSKSFKQPFGSLFLSTQDESNNTYLDYTIGSLKILVESIQPNKDISQTR